jgi:hypothetical protein
MLGNFIPVAAKNAFLSRFFASENKLTVSRYAKFRGVTVTPLKAASERRKNEWKKL